MKVNFLLKQIEKSIYGFTARRNNNKFKARNFHVSTTVLGAVSTIVLGLDLINVEWLSSFSHQTKNIALVISALITIVSAYNSFFDHKGLWVNYTNARSNLYNLKFEIEYYLEGNNNIEKEDIENYKNKYTKILNEVNHKWTNLRNE